MANLDRNFDLAPLYGVIKTKPAKVCPLTCERDFNMDGERRVKICRGAGSFLDDDKECEKKREKPSVKREELHVKRDRPERANVDTEPANVPTHGTNVRY
jgi:hypothetical protein